MGGSFWAQTAFFFKNMIEENDQATWDLPVSLQSKIQFTFGDWSLAMEEKHLRGCGCEKVKQMLGSGVGVQDQNS